MVKSIENCNSEGPVVAFISKMVHIRYININEGRLPHNHKGTGIEDLLLFGFARIFSGTLRRGDTIYVVTPRKKSFRKGSADSQQSNQEFKFDVVEVKVEHLYIWMGGH